MTISGKILTLVAIAPALVGAIAPANAQERGSGEAVVAAFQHYCFSQPFTVAEIKVNLSQDPALSEIELPRDFLEKSLKKTINENQSWSLILDGKPFELIVLRRSGFKKSGIQCFLRTAEPSGTLFPYLDSFRERMRVNGLSGREIDLPTFFRASGKVVDGRHTEARIITRSAWPAINAVRYTTLAALYE